MNFSGSGSTSASGGLTYAWNFGDGSTGTGASASHSYSTFGDVSVRLTVTDSGGQATAASQTITLVAPPATPTVSIDHSQVAPTSSITVTATGSDPQNSALTYSWDFGDGTTASGPSASHAFAAEGNYHVHVTATNQLGVATQSTDSIVTVAWLSQVAPSLILPGSSHLLGQSLFASAAYLDANGFTYRVDWDFGDSTPTISTTDAMKMVNHTYAATGSYVVKATVTNSIGHSVSAQATVDVKPLTTPPAAVDNTWQVYCSGAFCGAASTTSYGGHGTGIWRYHNTTGSPATINIAIDGLSQSMPATLLFSNGTVNSSSLPDPGTSSAPTNKITAAAARAELAAAAHDTVQAANRRLGDALLASGPAPRSVPVVRKSSVALSAAPALGTTRTWRENAFTGLSFNMTVAATCPLSTGRNAVIWVDADQLQSGALDPARVQPLSDMLCGTNGAYELLTAEVGDVWGSASSSAPNYVQDTPVLQDFNVVIPGVSQSQAWNGYFSAGDLLNSAASPTSNAAVEIVLNGWVFANYPSTDTATRGTLVHEMKHLINFYQRQVARHVGHEQWLEETSAMLAEDMISSRVLPYSRTEARVDGYSSSGGGMNYVAWNFPDGNSYNQGGSFGTFLHRRYGASLDVELMTMCADGGGGSSSYDCINDYIVRHGGMSFEDEFARMGASVFGCMMPSGGMPRGFGLPGMVVSGSPLTPIGTYQLESGSTPPRALGSTLGSTTHTYAREYMKAGQTVFKRDNVVVPPGTTLLLVIAEAVN